MKNILNKKGMTLVEVIVVLVILAILAAILIPSMVKWIDKAKERTVLAEARTVLLAAQTVVSEDYGVDGVNTADYAPGQSKHIQILALADITLDLESGESLTVAVTEEGKVESISFTRNGKTVNYANGQWS